MVCSWLRLCWEDQLREKQISKSLNACATSKHTFSSFGLADTEVTPADAGGTYGPGISDRNFIQRSGFLIPVEISDQDNQG
jgi:hypothetical protein